MLSFCIQEERAEKGRPTEVTNPNEKYLSTDHLLGDLKGRTISCGFITIAAQAFSWS